MQPAEGALPPAHHVLPVDHLANADRRLLTDRAVLDGRPVRRPGQQLAQRLDGALDHGAEGVRVNAVHPSMISTDMTAGFLQSHEIVAAALNRVPLQRFGEPAEAASVITFLASAAASYVNGAHIRVDGGLGASNGNPHIA